MRGRPLAFGFGVGVLRMRNVQANSTVGSPLASLTQRGKPILGIRARVIVIALLAIAPLMVERVRALERARLERAELARNQVIDLAPQRRRGAARDR